MEPADTDKFPLVSVMIPVYNGEKTLPFALASLEAQTYFKWKAIVVNDGSTDETKSILDKIKDKRYKIIHFQCNIGRPFARQAALEAAEGKYLAFLDADDLYHPEKLYKQVSLMENNPELDLVSCGNASYNNEFKIFTVRGKGDGNLKKFKSGDEKKAALRTSLVRLEIAKKIKFNLRLKHAQDTDYLFHYLPNRTYLISNDILYYYSEFVSVTGRKILKTYWYDLIRVSQSQKINLIKKIYQYTITCFKILITSIILPIKGTEYVIQKGGYAPSHNEKEEFEKLIMQLKETFNNDNV